MRVQSLIASPQVRGIPSTMYWLAYPISPPGSFTVEPAREPRRWINVG
ncbi:hypothetical protein Aazo_3199 ['Nostoc azollae' 0708]|uniref:Uncharacterized protein n=1 Tax=Nostoc azollae (strain 0708) TaxID=551115 RepID=D7E1Z1_NOSA0|nr:hypothetical protein Aazo_3199 ['Nostoc azollae' 0708]